MVRMTLPSSNRPIKSWSNRRRAVKAQKTYYLVDENGNKGNIYLSEGSKGNIRFTTDQGNPPRFDETKYYYFPIPFSEIQLNPNLEQPIGWR